VRSSEGVKEDIPEKSDGKPEKRHHKRTDSLTSKTSTISSSPPVEKLNSKTEKKLTTKPKTTK